MRTGARVALSLYIGFVVYTLLMLLFGSSGVLAYRALRTHSAVLDSNVEELEDIGDDLESRRDLLLYDTEELRLLGRNLGYFRGDEVRIVVPGERESGARHVLGRMVRRFVARSGDHSLYRAIATVVALIAFILGTVFFRTRDGHTAR